MQKHSNSHFCFMMFLLLVIGCSKLNTSVPKEYVKFSVLEIGSGIPVQNATVTSGKEFECNYFQNCNILGLVDSAITDTRGVVSVLKSSFYKIEKKGYWSSVAYPYGTNYTITGYPPGTNFLIPEGTITVNLKPENKYPDGSTVTLYNMMPNGIDILYRSPLFGVFDILPATIDTSITFLAFGECLNQIYWSVKDRSGLLLNEKDISPILVPKNGNVHIEIKF